MHCQSKCLHIFFNSPCDEMGRTHKALCRIPKYNGCLEIKHLYTIWVRNWTHHVCHETPSLREWMTDKLWYSDLGIWWIFSQKLMKQACHFKVNNWQYCTNDKIGGFQWKLEFWKTHIHLTELDRLPVLEDFSDEISDDINNHNFLNILTRHNIWKICIA